MTLRPLATADAKSWRQARERNSDWLRPWDATVPPGGEGRPQSFRALVQRLRRNARLGTTYPFAIDVGGRLRRPGDGEQHRARLGAVRLGRLLDRPGVRRPRRDAARGGDGRSTTASPVGLHRIEIAIRPENSNSLRVVEKLGLREVGYAPRYLHIDGAWRDHRLYAVTVEECPDGVLARLEPHQSHE